MLRRAPLDFRELRRRISPQLILPILGYPVWTRCRGLGRSGCPVHRSTGTRSRVMVSNSQVVYCHRCGFRGDALALVAAVRHLSHLEAAYELCRMAGYDPQVFRF